MANATKYRQYDGQPLSNVLRREIRKARLRVTLDEELGRATPDEVKKLAAFELPAIVRERPQDEGTADRSRDGGQTLSNALRTKILKARLRVTLDEQLGRTTPESAKKLAALDLPPFVRVPRQDGRAADRRTSDPQSDGPRSTSDLALLSNELRLRIRKARLRVALDEQLGRTSPESAKKLAALPLPPLFEVPRQDENAADRRTCKPVNEEPVPGVSRRKILAARLEVAINELRGRGTPPQTMRLSRTKLAPIMRVKHEVGGTGGRDS